jgi:hypothetical protein
MLDCLLAPETSSGLEPNTLRTWRPHRTIGDCQRQVKEESYEKYVQENVVTGLSLRLCLLTSRSVVMY